MPCLPKPAQLGMSFFCSAIFIAGMAFVSAGCGNPLPVENLEKAETAGSPPSPRFFGQRIPIGTMAPDFKLPSARDAEQIHLGDLCEEHPVVLVLGSFGCDYFCLCLEDLKKLHERFDHRAKFLFVYIDNNHPEPNLPPRASGTGQIPWTYPSDRLGKIRAGLDYYQLSFPCAVDSEDKQVLQKYEAFPARLFIIDQKGKIALDSGSVTRTGLNLAEVESWLEGHTPRGS